MFEELALPIENSVKMIIKHPVTDDPILDSEGNPAFVLLRHIDSREGSIARRKMLNKRLHSRKAKQNVEDIEKETSEYLAALVIDWYLVKHDGTPANIQCDESTKLKFLSDDSVKWIRDQIDTFAGDLENFLLS